VLFRVRRIADPPEDGARHPASGRTLSLQRHPVAALWPACLAPGGEDRQWEPAAEAAGAAAREKGREKLLGTVACRNELRAKSCPRRGGREGLQGKPTYIYGRFHARKTKENDLVM
jgi:hypothetical protein